MLARCDGPNSGYDTYSTAKPPPPLDALVEDGRAAPSASPETAPPAGACGGAFAPCNGTLPSCCVGGYECRYTTPELATQQCLPVPALERALKAVHPGFHAPFA